MQIEKFRVGETNQVALLKKPGKYPDFSIRNICANGRIAAPDGSIIDLYEQRKKENPATLNENGMSLGMILTYGDFRLFTAGDFSDNIKLADGTKTVIEEQLADVLYLYGELRQSRRLAAAIAKARPVTSTGALVDAVRPLLKPSQQKKELSMVFQALRIEVNGELEVLRRLLEQSVELLNPGGRLAVITYHSLEDRLVKNFMRSGNIEGKMEKDFYGRLTTPLRAVGKVIAPADDEVERNPRSRSAKLRVAEKV